METLIIIIHILDVVLFLVAGTAVILLFINYLKLSSRNEKQKIIIDEEAIEKRVKGMDLSDVVKLNNESSDPGHDSK